MIDIDDIDLLPASLLVPHYLIACLAYYEEAESLMSDAAFDLLARRLGAEWGRADHIHRHLIDRSALSSGGSYLRGKYPLRVKLAASRLLGRPLRMVG